MIPLLLDQGLPVGAARSLRAQGWDVVHVSERGLSRSPDIELLALAAMESRAVVTLDADFPMLIALQRREQPSVIHIRMQGLDHLACADLLLALVPEVLGDLRSGAVVSVQDNGVRVRRLPVR